MKLERIEPLVFNVSAKTNWFFIRVTSENGLTGVGEASLNGFETAQLAYARDFCTTLIGRPVAEIAPQLRVYAHSPGGLIASSIVSAVEQAVTDLRAKEAGLPVHLIGDCKVARTALEATSEGHAIGTTV